MPNAQLEASFVEEFIQAERRDRYRLLLGSPKRRKEILDRLNHNLDYISSFAHAIAGSLHFPDQVRRLLNERGVRDTDPVYIISNSIDLDAQTLPMREAVERVLQYYFGSVVCCAEGKVAYYRPEAPANGRLLERYRPDDR